MRNRVVAGNWKMNTTPSEGLGFIRALSDKDLKEVRVIIAAPYTHLGLLNQVVSDEIEIAAQNVNAAEKGAYTGEVSISMLKDLGVETVILGHSERRAYYHEDHQQLKDKVDACLSQDMNIIFCCGEPLDVRKSGAEKSYVARQLEESLFHLEEDLDNVIIAYEPIWAIGTGETATPEQAQEMHAYIRSLIEERYGVNVSEDIAILYGGSVKPANAQELFSKEDVDGGLVGGASLDVESFYHIINA